MDTIKFTCHGNSAPAYSCNKPGDQSGEYVSADEYTLLRRELEYFVQRVEEGSIRSRATYERFKRALAAARAVNSSQETGKQLKISSGEIEHLEKIRLDLHEIAEAHPDTRHSILALTSNLWPIIHRNREFVDKLDEQHPDDIAVDAFAAAMKEKLAHSRAKGRSGWDDPKQCSLESLASMLVEHVAKGDPLDVANLAMMLYMRGSGSEVLAASMVETRNSDIWFKDAMKVTGGELLPDAMFGSADDMQENKP